MSSSAFFVSDVFQNIAVAGFDELQEFLSKRRTSIDRNRVSVAIGATNNASTCCCTDNGSVLVLFQNFGQTLAACQLGLRGFIKLVGAELREGSQFAELRHVQTQRASNLPHGLDLRIAADAAHGNTNVDGGTNSGIEQIRLRDRSVRR